MAVQKKKKRKTGSGDSRDWEYKLNINREISPAFWNIACFAPETVAKCPLC